VTSEATSACRSFCGFTDHRLSERLLVKDGCVLTLDRALGDFERADVLVEGGRIAAVAPDLDEDAEDVIEAAGKIVMPGFVDTHRHTWQTALRGICADWTLQDYFRGIRLHLSTFFRPEDVYAGNYVGALEALDAGVTTVLDFSHCINSPAHADEAIRGLRDAGLRAIFAYGFYPVPLAEPRFADHDERLADARRIREAHFAASGGTVQMGLALTEIGLVPFETTKREVEAARELDLLVTAHVGSVADRRWPHEIELLHRAGLLDARQVHVHCNACTNEELGLIAECGAAVSVTPETELQMGMGFPITGRALSRGLRLGLGCDIVSLQAGDILSQLRLALQTERALENHVTAERGALPLELSLTARKALELGTIGGASALGLDSEIGSLTPGKAADLIVFDTAGMNFVPRNDPVAAVVLHARAGDVETVIVGGRVLKREGALAGVAPDRARRLIERSRDYLLGMAENAGGLLLELPAGWFEGVREAVLANVADV
jgi:5-methylthioadenosine/S-adenosylhomocysteine deaminase